MAPNTVSILQWPPSTVSSTLRPPSARPYSRHLGRDAALVQVDQVFGCDRGDPLDERLAAAAVLFAVALGGME